ncbi:MAG: peroxidase [Lysobacterales bacterium]|nr:MAG: peroxidase [Xanthomonadales bacterium]
MPYLRSLRAGASLIDVFKAFPATSTPLIEFHEVLLRGPSPFTGAERELIAAYVSGLNRCRFCHGVHTATAERMGVEPGLLPRIVRDGGFEGVADKLQPVLLLARKLTLSPSSVTKADADAVLAAGWDDTALYYAVAVTALFNFMNRLVEGLGIELDPGYVGPASERLADRGYLPLLEMMKPSRP